jgi:hypothetical protein
MEQKDTFYINREAFIRLSIDPKEAVEYLENKEAIDMNPAHVKALGLLKMPVENVS